MGKRLGELTGDNTKCMVEVNGITLIERMLGQLDSHNLKRIIIVAGYKSDRLTGFISTLDIKTPVIYVQNPIYDKTNNIYSLFLAKEYLTEDDTILLESDLIFEDKVLSRLIRNPYPSLALVAKYESWMNGTVVTIDEDCNITRFIDYEHFTFKDIPSYYKTVNIYKFSREFSTSHYVPFLKAYCKALGNNEYYEQVLRVISLLDRPAIKACTLESGDKWYEIDDIQDLDIAESIFTEDSLEKISSRYGGFWRYPDILDFCYLVNPYFPDRRLSDEIKSNFERLISHYPSGHKVNNLIAAKNFRIRLPYIAVGNGAAEIIKSLMEKVLKGKTGFVFPTFEEYPNRAEASDTVIYTPSAEDGFRYSEEDLIRYFSDKGISSLLVVNPDNPSGNFIPKNGLLKLCGWAAERNIRLVVDESFVDFSDESCDNTLIENDILTKYSNLTVIKSISKSFGVAGLRLGIAASADKNLIDTINRDLAIWNINSFAEFFMQIFSKYENEYRKACRRLIEERRRFSRELQKYGFLKVLPSQANYLLCEITGGRYTSSEMARILLAHNILIKDCSGKKGFGGKDYIRIAIRDTDDNNTLIRALKELQ